MVGGSPLSMRMWVIAMLVRRREKISDFFLKVMLLLRSSHGCHGTVYKHTFAFPTLRVYLQRGECYRFTIEHTLLCLEANALSTKPKEREKGRGSKKKAHLDVQTFTQSLAAAGEKKKNSRRVRYVEREKGCH